MLVDDLPQLGQVGGAQVVRDVVHRLGRQRPHLLADAIESNLQGPAAAAQSPPDGDTLLLSISEDGDGISAFTAPVLSS